LAKPDEMTHLRTIILLKNVLLNI